MKKFELEVGHVYAMTNEHIPGLVKIGMTTRTPEERSAELSGTGVPGKWNIEYSIFVPNCEQIEKKVHKALEKYRLSLDREFFKIEIPAAIEIIESHSQTLINHFPDWPNLEKVNEFIEKELAKIKNENSKRIQSKLLEIEIRKIKDELDKKDRILKEENEKLKRSKETLNRIDWETKETIGEWYLGGFEGFLFLVLIVSMCYLDHKESRVFFGFSLLFLSILLPLKWSLKKRAVKERREHNLPEL